MFNKLIRENPKALVFSSFQIVHQLAIAMVIPFFSLIFLESGWTNQQITYFFAIFTFVMFFAAPVIGKISDEIGRKKIILFGTATQILFLLTYYNFTENLYIIFFIRFFDAIGSGAVSITALSAFEDLIKEKRGFWTGVFFSLGSIGAITAPIIAGYVAAWSFSKVIFLVAIVFLIFSILLLIFIPEKKKKKSPIKLNDLNPLSEIKDSLKYRRLKGMALLGVTMNAKGQIMTIFLPIFIVKELGIPVQYFGLLWGIGPFFHMFQFYFGKIADKISAQFGVLLGVFITSAAMIFMPYVTGIKSLAILFIVHGIGGSIWNVSAWSLMSNIAEKRDIEGEVVGTYYSISYIGMFIASIFGAAIIGYFGIGKTLQIFAIAITIITIFTYFLFQPIFHHEKKKSYFHKIHDTKN